jgi:sigma-B regulation protein RsbU (phosphoserine phosphatase)
MPTSLTRLAQLLRRLSHLEKLFLVLGVLVVLSQGIERLTGSRLPLSGLLTFLWVLLCIGLGIKYLMWLVRRTVWSLRNRLILAYLFIGVVPIILVLVMLGIGMYVLMGQVATYLMKPFEIVPMP